MKKNVQHNLLMGLIFWINWEPNQWRSTTPFSHDFLKNFPKVSSLRITNPPFCRTIFENFQKTVQVWPSWSQSICNSILSFFEPLIMKWVTRMPQSADVYRKNPTIFSAKFRKNPHFFVLLRFVSKNRMSFTRSVFEP